MKKNYLLEKSSPTEIWDEQWTNFLRQLTDIRVNNLVVQKIFSIFSNNLVGKKIIELGAGSGSDAVVLALQGADVTVLDFSQKSLDVCRALAQKHKVKLRYILSDCKKIPKEDNSYDLVYSVGLVEHFSNPLPVLTEQKRIVKKDGYILVDVPQKYNLYTLVKNFRMKTGSFPFGWETQYSLSQLKSIGQSVGLTTVLFYGRDSAFTLKFSGVIRKIWDRYVSLLEKSLFAPYLCLNLGIVYKKR